MVNPVRSLLRGVAINVQAAWMTDGFFASAKKSVCASYQEEEQGYFWRSDRHPNGPRPARRGSVARAFRPAR